MCQWKNFENQSIIGEDMPKVKCHVLYGPRCSLLQSFLRSNEVLVIFLYFITHTIKRNANHFQMILLTLTIHTLSSKHCRILQFFLTACANSLMYIWYYLMACKIDTIKQIFTEFSSNCFRQWYFKGSVAMHLRCSAILRNNFIAIFCWVYQ